MLVLLSAWALITPALAQIYPERAIKIIVPQPPGGGFDTVARVLADRLSPLLGQPLLVENRPGAGTLVGTEAAAKAPPDGYTLLLGALSNIALNPGLYDKLSYDPLRDFVPIGLAVTWSYTLLARKDLPHKDLNELVAFARANPEQVTYASAGRGSGQHIAMAVTAQLAGIKLTHVTYRGAQAAY
jgi:tripartite-type tricarboxylate transporter receptor subunit TctC